MIKVEYLIDKCGAERFGTCAGCSKSSKDDPKMVAVTFKTKYLGNVVCLCYECHKELYQKIQEDMK